MNCGHAGIYDVPALKVSGLRVFAMAAFVAITVLADDSLKYLPILEGEHKEFAQIGEADRNRECSVFLKTGKREVDRIGPEGMITVLDGRCIVTGTLFSTGRDMIVVRTCFDAKRKYARQRSIVAEDIDYLVFRK